MEAQEPVLEQYFVGHSGPITSLAFSPTGKNLASSSEDNSFLVWNLSSNKASLRYKAKPLPVTYVTYSPQGSLIASSQGDFVRIWMTSIQGKSVEFKAHLGTVRSVEFSIDGEKLLTASNDKSIKVWNASRRRFLSSFTGHNNWVRLAKYSPDGDMIVSCSDDKTIRLWDPNSSKCIHTFHEMKGTSKYVSFHPTGTCIGAAMSHGAAKLYDLRVMKLLQYYSCHSAQATSLAFHPSGSYMITGSDDKTSKMIDLLEGRVVFTFEAHSNAVTAVEFSKSGTQFATASEDKKVFVWKSNIQAIEDHVEDKRKKCLRESVANNYDPNRPKIQIKPSSLSLNATHIEDIYSPKDYEANEAEDLDILDKEDEPIQRTPRRATAHEHLTKSYCGKLNETNSEDLLSLLEVLTYENETLKTKVDTLEKKVCFLEDSLKKKLLSVEERLSKIETSPVTQ